MIWFFIKNVLFSKIVKVIGPVFTWVSENPAKAVIIVLIILLGILRWYYGNRIESLEETITDNEMIIKNHEISVGNLKGSLKKQNDAIEALAASAKIQSDKLKEARKEADRKSEEHDKELIELRQQNVSKECPEAMNWMREKAIKELQW